MESEIISREELCKIPRYNTRSSFKRENIILKKWIMVKINIKAVIS